MTWRERALDAIEEVMESLAADATEIDAKRALREAYPFGDRAYWPYKVWLTEVRSALNRRFRPESIRPTKRVMQEKERLCEYTLPMEFNDESE